MVCRFSTVVFCSIRSAAGSRLGNTLLLWILAGLALLSSLAAQGARFLKKIDSALTDSIAAGERTLRAIVTMQPGFRDAVRNALRKHGDLIKSEHPVIESITAIIHGEDVSELANHPGVKYVSADATVFAGATMQPDSRVSPQNVVTTSTAASWKGAGAAVSTLRQTLGLPADCRLFPDR